MDTTWNKEGALLFKQGHYSEAITYFSKAIHHDPGNSVYLVNRSAAYASCNKFNEALNDANSAIHLSPNYVRAYLRKANALIQLKQYEEALITIEEGLKYEPQNQELLTTKTRAQTHLLVINPSLVQNKQQQLSGGFPIQTNTNSSEISHHDQSSKSINKSPESSTKRFMSGWFGTNKTASSYNKKGVEYLQKGNPENALIELNQAVQLSPTNHQFLCNRASALLSLNRISEAMNDINQVLELSPDFILGHVRKSQAYLLSNDLQNSRLVLNYANSIANSNKEKELVKNAIEELERRETYLSFALPNEDPPPYPGNNDNNDNNNASIIEDISKDNDSNDNNDTNTINKIVNASSSWFYSVLGEEKETSIIIVDENKQVIDVEGFLKFEMENNIFIKLIQEYLNSEYLSFSNKDGMILDKRPLFDTNSLNSGTCQLILLLPQNVSLEKYKLDEDFFLSHFAIASLPNNTLQELSQNEEKENEDNKISLNNNDNDSSVSFFSLNQIIGEINSKKESIKVLKNPHSDSNNHTHAQILREVLIQLGDYFPVKLFLISEPIWIAQTNIIKDSTNKKKEQEEEQLTIDQRFRKLYNQPQANGIRYNVKKFIKKIRKYPPGSLDQIAVELKTFMHAVDESIKTNQLWHNATNEDILCAHENIRKHILTQLIDIVFYSTFQQKDEEIRETINRLWFVLPEQLGLDSDTMDDSMYFSAQRELSSINAFLYPREKIECLLNCCRILNFQINSEGGYASADDFLPALICVLLNANPYRMWSNIEYMKRFCEKTPELSEAFYFLTMFEAAVCFISTVNAEQLRMSERLFQDYFSGAIPHHKPLSKDLFIQNSKENKNIIIPNTFIERNDETITIEEIPLLLKEYKILYKIINSIK